ncbi:MAG: hypothetical protein WD231_01900 [Candidatus Woykebacteria bacterium]
MSRRIIVITVSREWWVIIGFILLLIAFQIGCSFLIGKVFQELQEPPLAIPVVLVVVSPALTLLFYRLAERRADIQINRCTEPDF